MRKSFFIRRIVLIMAFILCRCIHTVNWHNNTNITTDVINQNIDISGINVLANSINVIAAATDILVTVTNTDSVVTTSLQLYLYAAADHVITVSLSQDLVFRGSQGNFLITFFGNGDLDFIVAGDHQVSFDADTAGHGTTFLTLMDTGVKPPQVTFKRYMPGSVDQALDATINVGTDSLISFGSQSGVAGGASGRIRFDATNTPDALGRLRLIIQDGGGIHVGGQQISTYANPTLADVSLGTPAGQSALVDLINSNAGVGYWSGLQVVNKNTQWPQMVSNPFLEPVGGQASQGKMTGFVLQANGILQIEDNAYLDYIGSYTNITLTPNTQAQYLDDKGALNQNIKDRNPSAFIVDGNPTNVDALPASINCIGTSALYFRSGVDSDNVSSLPTYTINPVEVTRSQGEIVFDVEGLLNVVGEVGEQSAMQILSMQVSPTGGSVYIHSNDTIFPLRTFAQDPYDNPYIYNSACFLINNRMNLFNTAIMHTDENHRVYENNVESQSEPAYIGGEYFKLARTANDMQDGTNILPRPKMALYNSVFMLHTSAALAGVDILITNTDVAAGNNSELKFYQNGRIIDEGSGRNLIMGTQSGSLASDLGTIINQDAHLDIIQEYAQTTYSTAPHKLALTIGSNNAKINNAIVGNIDNQYSVQALFLGHGSNISIGTNDSGFGTDFNTTPTLFIGGNFFSIETQGGNLNNPEIGVAEGEGSIFVDFNGIISIGNYRAKIGAMIGKSYNGLVDLPKRQVLFGNRVGVTQANLNLNDSSQWTIVAANERLSDYTLDWEAAIKDYVGTVTFIPYELSNTPLPCNVPDVIGANLVGLPTIKGEVDQFQILNSRLGDQATILVDGGLIRELIMLTNDDSVGTAPVGVVVMQNNCTVGLGSASRTPDSLDANVVLGVNGITLMPNGNCQLFLNDNAIIDNVAHIVTGTAFGSNAITSRLIITSVVPRELRIKSGGVLDLSLFDTIHKKLQIGGHVRLVLEPGASIIMNGGQLNISENAQLIIEPVNTSVVPSGSLTASDQVRATFIGNGNVQLSENATMSVLRDAYFGIETGPIATYVSPTVTATSCSNITTQTWTMLDASRIIIGNNENYGGAFQVGNTQDLGGIVDFTLVLNGSDAFVDLNNQGFFGLGVGVVTKPHGAPDNWIVAPLFNVQAITVNITEGTLQHNQIYPTSSQFASVLALGNPTNNIKYFFTADPVNGIILGGGNLVEISGMVVPAVTTTDGVINSFLSAGLLSSGLMFADPYKAINTLAIPATATQLFNYWKVVPYVFQSNRLATIFASASNQGTIGYVTGSTIVRQIAGAINGPGGSAVTPTLSEQLGVVGMSLNNGQIALTQINS